MKTQHGFRPGRSIPPIRVAWGVFYGLTCLGGGMVTGWRVWVEHPGVMFPLALCLLLLPRPLTGVLIMAGILSQGFYCDISRRRACIHLSPWTSLRALNGPSQGRKTRDSLLRALGIATDRLNRGDVDEIVMASRMLTAARIQRTLRQAGVDGQRYQVRTMPWQESTVARMLLQAVLLLTRWHIPERKMTGSAVLITRRPDGNNAGKSGGQTVNKRRLPEK